MKNFPKKISHWIALQKDMAQFGRDYRFLARAQELEEIDRRVLIVSLSNWVAQIKVEAMLAAALRVRGWSPTVLTLSNYEVAKKYFRASGIDRFVYFDKLANNSQEAASKTAVILKNAHAFSFKTVLDLKEADVDIGRHLLSSLVRTLRSSCIDFKDPNVQPLLGQLLQKSFESAQRAHHVLESVQPQLLLFLEKGYTPYGEIFDVALSKNIESVQWLHSHRMDALLFKRYTAADRYLHPSSVSLPTWNALREELWSSEHEKGLMEELTGRYESGSWFNRKYLQANKRIKTTEEVRTQLGLDPSKKTAVVFSHVLWDATFFFGENLFDDYEQWLVETVKEACRNDRLNWVIKLHPDYVWKLKLMGGGSVRDTFLIDAAIGQLPGHVKLMLPETDINTFSLFGVTDYCLTVRGTIGIEMSCFGIPVFTAGTGRYSGLGFTIDSSDPHSYREKLRTLHEFPSLTAAQTELAKKHAYAILRRRPLPFTTFEQVQMPLQKLGHPLDHNVVIRADSFQNILTAPDLRLFSDWITDSHTPDFLMP